MKLIKLKNAFEYRGPLDFEYKVKVKHYVVELND